MLSNGDIVVVVNAYDINGNFEEIAQKVDNNGTLLELSLIHIFVGLFRIPFMKYEF